MKKVSQKIVRPYIEYEFNRQEFRDLLGIPKEDGNVLTVTVDFFKGTVVVTMDERERA